MPTLAVIWRVAGLLLATSADSVIEVLPPLSSQRIAAVPEWVRGMFTYRARLIPLVDAAGVLGEAASPDRMTNRVLVLRVGEAGSPVEWPVGLWVESVLDLERVEFGAADGHPGFEIERGRFLGPIASTRWGQVQLVKPGELFTPQQASLLSQRLAEAAA